MISVESPVTKTIQEILDTDPTELEKLSSLELSALLAPYFPAVRTPVLPEEGSIKHNATETMLKQFLASAEAQQMMKKL